MDEDSPAVAQAPAAKQPRSGPVSKVSFISKVKAETIEEKAVGYWSNGADDDGGLFEGVHLQERAANLKADPEVDRIATEKALDNLLENKVARDIPREEGKYMKKLTTRWEKCWRKKASSTTDEWEFKVRFVGREYKWAEFREDLFAPGAAYCTGRIVDLMALKLEVPTFTLDCTDAYHQAPELEDIVVEPPPEYLARLAAEGRSTHIWWKLERQLPGRRPAGQRWIDHFCGIATTALDFERCACAPQFYWGRERGIGFELHGDDVHGFGAKHEIEKFKVDLGPHIKFRDGGVHGEGACYDHLKRPR